MITCKFCKQPFGQYEQTVYTYKVMNKTEVSFGHVHDCLFEFVEERPGGITVYKLRHYPQ